MEDNERLINANALMHAMGVKNAVKYGNETAEQQHNSYDTLMKYEIADYIEDAPTVNAVEVVRCRDCKEAEDCPVVCGDCLYCNVWQTVVRCNGYCDHAVKMDE